MAYRIDLEAPLAAELRRVAADQLGSAVAGLEAAGAPIAPPPCTARARA